MHDVKLAAAEARRSVKDLEAVALVLPNQQVNERGDGSAVTIPLGRSGKAARARCFHGIQMAYQEHLGQRYLDNSLWRTPWAIRWR